MKNLSKKSATRIATLFNQLQCANLMASEAAPENIELWKKQGDEATLLLAIEFGIYLPALSIAYDKARDSALTKRAASDMNLLIEIRRQRKALGSTYNYC